MFSIIVVSWNNRECLNCLLDSIDKYSEWNHEILIQDTKYNAGLCNSANRLSKAATKDFICPIDDDIVVLPGWDKALLDAHKKYSKKWISSTRIEPLCPPYGVKGNFGRSPSQLRMDELLRFNEQLKLDKIYINNSNYPLLIPTEFWHEIGGYDTDFDPGIGSEVGLAKRCWEHGVRDFLQVPDSRVYHFQSTTVHRLKDVGTQRSKREQVFKNKYGLERQEFITKYMKKGSEWHDTTI